MTDDRAKLLQRHLGAIGAMLMEKEVHYGEKGGFFQANQRGQYAHAIGEAKLKLDEFTKTGNVRMLVKACAWMYLVYETEVILELDNPQGELPLNSIRLPPERVHAFDPQSVLDERARDNAAWKENRQVTRFPDSRCHWEAGGVRCLLPLGHEGGHLG